MDRPTAGMRWLCSLLGSASSASWVLVRSGQSIARPGTRRPRRDGTGLEQTGNEAEPDGERGPRALVNPAGQRLSLSAPHRPPCTGFAARADSTRGWGGTSRLLPACRPERWQRLASRCSRSELRSTQDGQQLPHRDPPTFTTTSRPSSRSTQAPPQPGSASASAIGCSCVPVFRCRGRLVRSPSRPGHRGGRGRQMPLAGGIDGRRKVLDRTDAREPRADSREGPRSDGANRRDGKGGLPARCAGPGGISGHPMEPRGLRTMWTTARVALTALGCN